MIMKKNYLFSLVLITTLGLFACQAHDLGDEEALSFTIDKTNPTWDNGIGALINAKCANCHTPASQRSKFVPSNTPTTYDAIGSAAFFDSSNATLIQKVYEQVFTATTKIMPPNFATPLTDDEKTALKTYLQSKVATVASICGLSGSTALTYSTTAGYLNSACSSCHNAAASGRSQFGTLAEVKTNRIAALLRLKETDATKVMPQNNLSYKSGTEGTALINWLCFGTDLN